MFVYFIRAVSEFCDEYRRVQESVRSLERERADVCVSGSEIRRVTCHGCGR